MVYCGMVSDGRRISLGEAAGRVYEPAPREGRLSSDNRRYLEKVLRLRPGDPFLVTDGLGNEGSATLGPDGTFTLAGWGPPVVSPPSP